MNKLGKSRLVKGAKKNAPTILTVTGIVCFGVSIFTAVRETPKYQQLLDEEKDIQDSDGKIVLDDSGNAVVPTKKKLLIAAKVYWPTAVIAGLGAASLIGANYVSVKRQKALSAAYMGATEALQRYQKHVIEHLDENTVKKIEESVAQDDISEHKDASVIEPDVEVNGEESSNLYWVYDRIGNRYFKSNEDRIKAACARANARMAMEMTMNFNELCDMIGLPWIPIGDILEWNIARDDYSEIGNTSYISTDYIIPKFINGQKPDGTPCKEWTFERLPITNI